MADKINYEALYELCKDKCKGCKHCVVPYRFPTQYTCSLNKNRPLSWSDEFRGYYNSANPTMCNDGTTEYEF
jgi:hypothetical protein